MSNHLDVQTIINYFDFLFVSNHIDISSMGN